MTRRHGFTLIEFVVALTLLTVGVLGGARLIAAATRRAGAAERGALALEAAATVPVGCPATPDSLVAGSFHIVVDPLIPRAARVSVGTGGRILASVVRADGCPP